MGRIFETRKNRMFARWSKMSKAFTKIGKELAIAVKMGGPDPSCNPRLRMAIQTGRSLNMPKEKIDGAIKRASSKDESGLEEIVYEAYGPHGIAMFVEAATNNPTRTVANVRNVFSKHGGSLATSGALDYLFVRQGVFTMAAPTIDLEELELELIDHGLEEMFETEDGDLLIYSSFAQYGALQKALEERHLELKSAGLQRTAFNLVDISPEQQVVIDKIIDLLEDDDDVQIVYHNMRHSD